MNLLISGPLLRDLREAIVVLMLRNPIGVIQSLGRSHRAGYKWAARSVENRARVYRRFYERVGDLPKDRLVCVSYDALCRDPIRCLRRLRVALAAFGIDMTGCDPSRFAESHATHPTDKRRTLAVREENGAVVFRSIPSYDPVRWPPETTRRIRRLLGGTVKTLEKLASPEDVPGLFSVR